MTDKEKDTESKGIKPSDEEHLLSHFEEMDHCFGDFFHPGWMHPYRHRWPNWGDFGPPSMSGLKPNDFYLLLHLRSLLSFYPKAERT